jgi:hypothetical protein
MPRESFRRGQLVEYRDHRTWLQGIGIVLEDQISGGQILDSGPFRRGAHVRVSFPASNFEGDLLVHKLQKVNEIA